MAPRYTYFQCGNCIDIIDVYQNKTVAVVNCMNDTAQETFEWWLEFEAPREVNIFLGAALTGASLLVWFIALWALTGSN